MNACWHELLETLKRSSLRPKFRPEEPKVARTSPDSAVRSISAEPRLECLTRSLRNLGRGCVDLLQYHVWSDEWATDPAWLDTIGEVRQRGLARFIGISANDHEPENVLLALKSGLVDCVQVIYNVFDQSPGDQLFPYCLNHDIGVIARVPFDEGSLAGKVRPETTFPDRDFRNYYFRKSQKSSVGADSVPDNGYRGRR